MLPCSYKGPESVPGWGTRSHNHGQLRVHMLQQRRLHSSTKTWYSQIYKHFLKIRRRVLFFPITIYNQLKPFFMNITKNAITGLKPNRKCLPLMEDFPQIKRMQPSAAQSGEARTLKLQTTDGDALPDALVLETSRQKATQGRTGCLGNASGVWQSQSQTLRPALPTNMYGAHTPGRQKGVNLGLAEPPAISAHLLESQFYPLGFREKTM